MSNIPDIPDVPPDPTGQPAPQDRSARRVRRWVGQSKRWTEAERIRVETALRDRRETSTLIGAGFEIRELDLHVGGGILAGAVAFRMFLFLVPFAYILFSVVGLAARAFSQDPAQAAKTVGITGVL